MAREDNKTTNEGKRYKPVGALMHDTKFEYYHQIPLLEAAEYVSEPIVAHNWMSKTANNKPQTSNGKTITKMRSLRCNRNWISKSLVRT